METCGLKLKYITVKGERIPFCKCHKGQYDRGDRYRHRCFYYDDNSPR